MGIALIGYDATFEDVQVPAIDLASRSPEQIAAMQAPPVDPNAPPPEVDPNAPPAPPVEAAPAGIPQMGSKQLVYQCYYGKRHQPLAVPLARGLHRL
jgi:hypothetical protein